MLAATRRLHASEAGDHVIGGPLHGPRLHLSMGQGDLCAELRRWVHKAGGLWRCRRSCWSPVSLGSDNQTSAEQYAVKFHM